MTQTTSSSPKRNVLEQGRAKFAYECAEKASKEDYRGDYQSYVRKLPMLIKTNGLGATLAYINSNKKGDAYKAIYKDIADWLKQDEKQLIDFPENELMKEIISKSSSEYHAITIEVMAFLSWLKRFVDGLIQEEKKADDNGKG